MRLRDGMGRIEEHCAQIFAEGFLPSYASICKVKSRRKRLGACFLRYHPRVAVAMIIAILSIPLITQLPRNRSYFFLAHTDDGASRFP